MYAITIKFDWQSEGDNYHFLEARGERYGNVIFGKKTDGLFRGYCPLTYQDAEFTTLEEAKKWVIGEVHQYFKEQWEIEVIEETNAPESLREIRCDRCGAPANFQDGGGNCPECGDDLCIQCACTWTELAEDDEPGHSVCKRCRNKYISDNTFCDRCRKRANVGSGGAVCPKCENILCGTCGWWSEGDDTSLCIRCRREVENTAETNNPKALSAEELLEIVKPKVNFEGHVNAGEELDGWERVARCLADDLSLTLRRLAHANKIIDREHESTNTFLRYCDAHGISGEDIRRWEESQNGRKNNSQN